MRDVAQLLPQAGKRPMFRGMLVTGRSLLAARHLLGLTQEEAASAAGTTRRSLGTIEGGALDGRPYCAPRRKLVLYYRAQGVTIEELDDGDVVLKRSRPSSLAQKVAAFA